MSRLKPLGKGGTRLAIVQKIVVHPLQVQPIQFNSGPTPRHAVLDFVRLVESLSPDLRERVLYVE